jgi:octaprenyl-diphosphate synthase
VLDLAGDAEVVGKTLGKDLEKGKLTLPLIRYLQTSEERQRDELVAMLHQPNAENYRQVGQLLAGSDAMTYARQRAEALVEEARGCLAQLPDSAAKASLITMAGAVISRSF